MEALAGEYLHAKGFWQAAKIEIDGEVFNQLDGTVSQPIEYRKGKKIAMRVISQFGEESTKVLLVNDK